MPKCTINGKEVEVAPGSTIIEAFMKTGEDIAHYCWHPGLSVAGVCRMCMCEINGNPRPQIACNTPVTEGMVVNNTSEKIKESVKWVLEFHLINHPLDCPICDQAGECGLQEYYMKHGSYDSEMGVPKVKKRKVIDLGERVVLDQERCILCSRCVRFTDEVTKTGELGIFNRGDHAEVATHEDKPLNNKYSQNVVDICPVGALTSKDFRFRQRVWFLKDFETVCNGCSTGCNIKVSYNENGLYRVRPVYNKDVNGYWMCDEGRDLYKHINLENRQLKAMRNTNGVKEQLAPGAAAKTLGKELKSLVAANGKDSVALLLTAQYTNEELESLTKYFAKDLGTQNIFYWKNNPESFESFDGMLLRGDKNPNTAGLKKVLAANSATGELKDLKALVESGKVKTVVVAGPENHAVYPDLAQVVQSLGKAQQIWLSACASPSFDNVSWVIPVKTFVEKSGTFTNQKGLEQQIKRGTTIVSEALTLNQIATLFAGGDVTVSNEFPAPSFAMGAV